MEISLLPEIFLKNDNFFCFNEVMTFFKFPDVSKCTHESPDIAFIQRRFSKKIMCNNQCLV